MVFSKKKKNKAEVMAAVNSRSELAQSEMYGGADTGFDIDDPVVEDYDRNTAATLVDHVLLNRPLKAILAMVVLAVVIPTVLYAYLYGVAPPPTPFGTCIIQPDFWSDCMPGNVSVDARSCELAGCCWNTTLSFCYHSIPSRQTYFSPDSNPDPETRPVEMSPRQKFSNGSYVPTPLGAEPIKTLYFRLTARTANHVVMQLSASEEPPPTPNIPLKDSLIDADVQIRSGFWLTFSRKISPENLETLFSTKNGPLIASNGFWEFSLQFPGNTAVLGAGSAARGSLKLVNGNATIYTGPRGPTNGRPFLLCLHQSGRTHGVLFDSPGAVEVISRRSNLVSLRSTAENRFHLHIFVGDSPREVLRYLTDYTGRATMPPLWTLGIHVCRDSARLAVNNDSLVFSQQAAAMDLMYDSDCVDESALGNTTFANEIETSRIEYLNEAIQELNNNGRHYVLSLLPQVANLSDAFMNYEHLFVQAENGSETFFGSHRDFDVAFPDFMHEETLEWFSDQVERVLINVSLKPEAVVLPENWPLNENENWEEIFDQPLYVPEGLQGSLSNGTIWWSAEHSDGTKHHAVHASYGSYHSRAALEALRRLDPPRPELNPVVFTTSKDILQGTTGAWLGDTHPATWDGLKASLLSVLEAGISGEPFSGGGAVCGSQGNWSDTLCTRWSLLALAAFPMVRYHHAWDALPRDPTSMVTSSARVVTNAAHLRYQLLPYLYTLVREAVETGFPVTRAMALEFPNDNGTWSLDEQMMVGSSILVAPVLKPTDVTVPVYLPSPASPWFHLQGGEMVTGSSNNTGWVTLLAGENEMTILLRGGFSVLMQEHDGKNSLEASQNYRLVVSALNCSTDLPSLDCTSRGHAYLGLLDLEKQGEIQFFATAWNFSVTNVLNIKSACDSQDSTVTNINEILIYGVPNGTVVANVSINGLESMNADLNFDVKLRRLHIFELDLDLCQFVAQDKNEILVSWPFNAPSGS